MQALFEHLVVRLALLMRRQSKQPERHKQLHALVALALLVAQSSPADKDIMVKLIINLINE